jgi:hypothetical protein
MKRCIFFGRLKEILQQIADFLEVYEDCSLDTETKTN